MGANDDGREAAGAGGTGPGTSRTGDGAPAPGEAGPAQGPIAAAGNGGGAKRGRRFSDKFYLASSTMLQLFARVGTTVVMGRFLTPDDYGLFTLVMLAPAVVTSLGDFSTPAAIVQLRADDEREVLDTGLVLVSVLGAVQFVALTAGGVLLYVYNPATLHDWRVVAVGAVVGLSTWLMYLYAAQLATLNRQRRFGQESRQNVIYTAVAAGSGVLMAVSGLGVFALALQSLLAQVVAGAAILRHVPLRFPARASWRMARQYVKFCSGVAGSNYVSVLEGRAFEYAVVGAAGDAGKARLGEWNRGLTVQSLVSQNFCSAVDRVAFPAVCAAQHDLPRAREISARHLETLTLLTVFLGVALYFCAADVVRVVLGPGWGMLPPLLAVLAVAVPMTAMTSAGYTLCTALGRTTAMAVWTVSRAAVVVPVVLLVPWAGATGVAWLWVASRGVAGLGLLVAGWRVAGAPSARTFFHILGVAVAGAVAAGAFWALYHYAAPALPGFSGDGLIPSVLRLLTFGTAALVVYLGTVAVLARDVLKYVRNMSSGR